MSSIDELLQPGPRYDARPPLDAIRCCLFDVDNTLAGNNSPSLPTDRFLTAVKRANGQVHLGLATARSWQKVAHIIDSGLNGLSILSNGAQIYDSQSRQIIIELALDTNVACDIVRALQHRDVDHWIQDSGQDHFWLSEKSQDNSLGSYAHARNIWQPAEGANRELVTAYQPRKPFVIVAHDVRTDLLQSLAEMGDTYQQQHVTSLVAHEHPQFDGSKTYDVFFLDERANKQTALQTVAETLGISTDQIMAVGDGLNDTVLVARAGVGVAMGNAVEQTKRVATFIAPDVQHDGAAIALEQLLRHL